MKILIMIMVFVIVSIAIVMYSSWLNVTYEVFGFNSSLLEDCKWTSDRIESFNKIYLVSSFITKGKRYKLPDWYYVDDHHLTLLGMIIQRQLLYRLAGLTKFTGLTEALCRQCLYTVYKHQDVDVYYGSVLALDTVNPHIVTSEIHNFMYFIGGRFT